MSINKIEHFEPVGDSDTQEALFNEWKRLGMDVASLNNIVQNEFFEWRPEWASEWSEEAERQVLKLRAMIDKTRDYLNTLKETNHGSST